MRAPGLADAGAGPLRVRDLPYLRTVAVSGGADRPWAHPLSLAIVGTPEPETDDVDDELFAAVEAEVTPADLFMTIYTSGTTSDPKGVVHTHGNFLRHGANLARFQGVTAEDRTFCAMPFFWIGGVGCALNMALATGSAVLCIENFRRRGGARHDGPGGGDHAVGLANLGFSSAGGPRRVVGT